MLGEGGPLRQLWIVAAILGLAVAFALLDEGRGVPAWLRMRADLEDARGRMEALERDIAEAEDQARRLREDPFAIEEAIREDLGLARPGETVVRLAAPGSSNIRIP
jgi:cell division protein FtsB